MDRAEPRVRKNPGLYWQGTGGGRSMKNKAGVRRESSGFAMISVLLVIMIFFIITIAISTYVVLQARITYEASLKDMAYYLADSGIRFVNAEVINRYFFRITTAPLTPGGIIDNSVYWDYPMNFDLVSDASLKSTLYLYAHPKNPTFATPVDLYYVDSVPVYCTARIYHVDNSALPVDTYPNHLIAMRTVKADIYLADALTNTSRLPGGQIPNGMVK